MMEPYVSYYHEVESTGNVYEVYDLKKLPAILDVEDAVEQIDMAALKNYILGSTDHDTDEVLREDAVLQRLSLAYENLYSIPKIIVDELGNSIQILDVSHNKIDDLSFLGDMSQLTSLICDHNLISSRTEIPYAPNLELLWMNHCKISELFPWCRKLRNSLPNLKYLSLMGNPAVPSYITGGSLYDCMQYRLFMISLFPRLIHLDERRVTCEEREEADKLYQKPLFGKFIPVANTYLRRTTEKLSEFFSSTPIEFKHPDTNGIV